MIVVLDTNIWLKELALNTNTGSALRFFLKQGGHKIALPEVIELEVRRNLLRDIQDAVLNLEQSSRRLLSLFGTMKEVVLPTEQQIDNLLDGVFENLKIDLIRIPFSLDAAKSSFEKTVDKIPPSDKTQEFKDGVIWYNCLELLEQDDVVLVTQDKAFFRDRSYTNGLALNLIDDARSKERTISIVSSAIDLLDEIKVPLKIENQWLAMEIRKNHVKEIEELLKKVSVLEDEKEAVVTVHLFSTENPENVHMEFCVEYPCRDIFDEKKNVVLRINGKAVYRPSLNELANVYSDEEGVYFENSDGSQGKFVHSYMSSIASVGHKTVAHVIRMPLDCE